ncbi:response regulator transcription factor [Alcaligenaceae bacterium CGII-47]|nr:response regulator transcription factor [Alcaligenaceae bacterium CGII-47]
MCHVNTRIASLEDDPAHAALIHQILTGASYRCTSFSSGTALLKALQKSCPFDLLLIDWEVPDVNGIEIVQWVRSHVGNDLPIMLLTNRTLEADLVIGLQSGADDYMSKPIRAGELLARISALLRRNRLPSPVDPNFSLAVYDVDLLHRSIHVRQQAVTLTSKEFDLAVLFLKNPWRLFTRDALSFLIWKRDIPATSRTLDTHLSGIRKKLQLQPQNGVCLSSSYALGYRLELVPLPEASD